MCPDFPITTLPDVAGSIWSITDDVVGVFILVGTNISSLLSYTFTIKSFVPRVWAIEWVVLLENESVTVDELIIEALIPVKLDPSPWNEPEKLLLTNEEAETCPSTDKLVSFKSCNESLLNLAVITFEPAFLFANSIRPSSVPSEASKIFAVIFAYTTSWSASFCHLF